MRNLAFSLVLLVTFGACSDNTTEPVVGLKMDSAMVVSAQGLASQVGVDILKKGGSAVDAAIAVQFALAVVFPAAGNIGGGGFMLIRFNDGKTAALDFREKAPSASTTNMYLDDEDNIVDGLSTSGHLASGVPGSVDGMVKAHTRYGTLPWATLVQPSIDLALNGFPLSEREAGFFNNLQADLVKYNSIIPDFLIRDYWNKGDTIRWEDLGHTLERIRDHGRAGFYEGKTAEDIVAEMERGNGLITLEDLKNYNAVWRDAVVSNYKDYKIIGMPPPSSGGICVTQLLKSVEKFPIKKWGHNSSKSVHLMVESEKRVYADRSKYIGDPDFNKIPVYELIDEKYIDERMTSFNQEQAIPSREIQNGVIDGYESEETTHFSIIDSKGNAVAVTTTINLWFGSKVVVAGSGFFLNDEMDDFTSKPNLPNIFGLTGGEVNKIESDKRMLSAMSPTILEKNDSLFMVVGTPGGATIITSVFQVILNVIEHGMGMQESVNAKRFHSQWLPDSVFIEPQSIAKNDSLELVNLGHTLVGRKSIGRVDAILITKDKKLEAGADYSRGDDEARGY